MSFHSHVPVRAGLLAVALLLSAGAGMAAADGAPLVAPVLSPNGPRAHDGERAPQAGQPPHLRGNAHQPPPAAHGRGDGRQAAPLAMQGQGDSRHVAPLAAPGRGDAGQAAPPAAQGRSDGRQAAPPSAHGRGDGRHAAPPAVHGRGDGRHAAPPVMHGRGDGRWFDGAHGHAQHYPAHGWAVRHLPPQSRYVWWSGARYGFYDGIWYAPGSSGYVVVRPPFGIVVSDLPAFRTLVTIGGIGYLYANSVYYRERSEGGYEVVPAPVALDAQVATGEIYSNSYKVYVYPRLNQSAQQQASDEYECHRWAVTQSGFDPTAAATGGNTVSSHPAQRGDYHRARSACLEGRNYTVR